MTPLHIRKRLAGALRALTENPERTITLRWAELPSADLVSLGAPPALIDQPDAIAGRLDILADALRREGERRRKIISLRNARHHRKAS